MLAQRLQAAFPSYIRTIIDELYAAHQISSEAQEQIEMAMSLLLEHGQRFAVDFGVLNAREKLALTVLS